MSSDEGSGLLDVLIVSTVAHAEDKLRRLVEEGARAKVVVPVVGEGIVDWLANDEDAFARAQAEAARLGDQLPIKALDTSAGDSDVALAVQDALAQFPAREVVIVTGPADEQRIAERLQRIRIPLADVRVRIVTLEAG